MTNKRDAVEAGIIPYLACVLFLLIFHCSPGSEPYTFLLPESRNYLIIGDSLTERSDGFYLENLSPDPLTVYIRGVDGYDYRDWYLRMDQAFAGIPSPDRIITVLGSNDAARFSGQDFLDNVNQFHEAIRQRSSATVFYTQVPRSRYLPIQNGILSNNALLESNLPAESRLIDLDTPFETHLSTGGAPLYPQDDAIHPNRTGYTLMGTIILEALYRD
ncbi:MAG: SGNH/GDSL hydrolase family protein [Leptospiraceae bacterium]